MDRLPAVLPVLPLDEAAADAAAGARMALEAAGRGIGMADYRIAGICLARSVSLLTRNHRHFGRVDGLMLEPLPGLS